MRNYKFMGKIDMDSRRHKLGYNDVYVTVFDKNTGRIIEYNKELDVIKSHRFDTDSNIDEPLWFINIYGDTGNLVVTFDNNNRWTRYVGTTGSPLRVEHSSGIKEFFKYHDNCKVMFHKIINGKKEYTYYYDEDGTLIHNKINGGK